MTVVQTTPTLVLSVSTLPLSVARKSSVDAQMAAGAFQLIPQTDPLVCTRCPQQHLTISATKHFVKAQFTVGLCKPLFVKML